MLKKERLVGSQNDLLGRAKDFWCIFEDSIQDIVFDTDGSLDQVEKQKTVRFYDTADHRLRENNEDIKLPFIKLYSFSMKQPTADGKYLSNASKISTTFYHENQLE